MTLPRNPPPPTHPPLSPPPHPPPAPSQTARHSPPPARDPAPTNANLRPKPVGNDVLGAQVRTSVTRTCGPNPRRTAKNGRRFVGVGLGLGQVAAEGVQEGGGLYGEAGAEIGRAHV